MNIKGKHILPTDIATLWPMLQDEKVLARIAPGVSNIEKVGEDQYKAISDISIGPVRGSFEGDLSLKDKVELEEMTLVLGQKSKIGNAEATIRMQLSAEDTSNTLVTYDGTAKISGKLATMGQRIIGGVVSTLSKQVFKELEKIIKEQNVLIEQAQLEKVGAATESGLDASVEQVQLENTGEKKTNKKKSFLQSIIELISSLWK